MGLSSRLFLVSEDDALHALASSAFMRMLRHEGLARLPDFAGQRVRLASVVVQMAERRAVRVVYETFSILDIGTDGLADISRFNSQQMARMDTVLTWKQRDPSQAAEFVDAASRFIARGGEWKPSPQLLRSIEPTALGVLPCRRVRVAR